MLGLTRRGVGGKIDSRPITLEPPRKIPIFSNANRCVSQGDVHTQRLPLQDLPLKHAWPPATASASPATPTVAFQNTSAPPRRREARLQRVSPGFMSRSGRGPKAPPRLGTTRDGGSGGLGPECPGNIRRHDNCRSWRAGRNPSTRDAPRLPAHYCWKQ